MVLKLNQIRKSFGATKALDGVDFELAKGEAHALIGENGAGKSTLMNVLAGAFKQDSGTMELKGELYQPNKTLDSRKKGIALIHQELSLAPHLSVAENILMGIEKSRFGWLDWQSLNSKANRILESFHHPDISSETIVGTLSVAAQQVVEICRAIAAGADIILMDEPTSSLHRDDVKNLFDLIRKLKTEGISIIYISHFLEEIREIADSFTVLRDGKSVATGKIAEVTDDFLITKMVGRSVENLFPQRTSNFGETILEVKNLSVPPTVKSASFSLRRGEILGIAGLIGSGRSELVKAIYGLRDFVDGEINLANRQIRNLRPNSQIRNGIGYVSEDRKGEGLALTMSVADNLTLTKFSKLSRLGWLNLAKQKQIAEDLVNQVGVKTKTATQTVSTLSGGNQQKVTIGRLIHQEADILLLDEPTRGIDIGSKAQVYETIARLAESGKAILLVSSYLPEIFGMCDSLAVMSRGVLSETLPISEWTHEKVMQKAIGGGEI